MLSITENEHRLSTDYFYAQQWLLNVRILILAYDFAITDLIQNTHFDHLKVKAKP